LFIQPIFVTIWPDLFELMSSGQAIGVIFYSQIPRTQGEILAAKNSQDLSLRKV